MDRLTKLKPRREAFDNLVLSDNIKEVVEAIPETYAKSKSRITSDNITADFIRGKGEGKIFLLYGAPGKSCRLPFYRVKFDSKLSYSMKVLVKQQLLRLLRNLRSALFWL